MSKTFDEQICASTPEPALDPTDDWMAKATFRDNLAQGKVRWRRSAVLNGPGVQATTETSCGWISTRRSPPSARARVSRLSSYECLLALGF